MKDETTSNGRGFKLADVVAVDESARPAPGDGVRLANASPLQVPPTLMQRTARLDAAMKALHAALTATEERIGSNFGDTSFPPILKGPLGDWLEHFAAHAEQMTGRVKAVNVTL